jgi:DNA-binding CsgD family transcriptional regulator
LFYLPSVDVPAGAALAVMCVSLAASAFSFIAVDVRSEPLPPEGDASWMSSPFPPRRVILGSMASILFFVVIAGILDNIYFFESALNGIPYFTFWFLLYNSLTDAAAGCLFDRYRWTSVAAASFAAICIGQSMSFFTKYDLMAYPYLLLSGGAQIVLEVFLVALPIAYCARTGMRGILPGLGYICLHASYVIFSMAYEFLLPVKFYRASLGVVLLLSMTAAYTVLSLSAAYERYRLERQMPRPVQKCDYREKYGLTLKESEVLEHLVNGAATPAIADRMFITERTVNFHISSLLKKTSCKNRIEMIFKLKG